MRLARPSLWRGPPRPRPASFPPCRGDQGRLAFRLFAVFVSSPIEHGRIACARGSPSLLSRWPCCCDGCTAQTTESERGTWTPRRTRSQLEGGDGGAVSA